MNSRGSNSMRDRLSVMFVSTVVLSVLFVDVALSTLSVEASSVVALVVVVVVVVVVVPVVADVVVDNAVRNQNTVNIVMPS